MRVVVTRPAHSGDRTARRLAALGHEAMLLPLSKPIHDPQAALQALSSTQGAIAVTSAEAIRTLTGVRSALAPHLDRPIFAVGKATADEAARVGFTAIRISQGDGADLADMIGRQSGGLPQTPLLYLAGSPRAAGFETQLATLRMPFHVAEVYRMESLTPNDGDLQRLFIDAGVDVVLLYSRQTAAQFFDLPFLRQYPTALHGTKFFCLSVAVAETVPRPLRSLVEVASTPDEDSLLTLLSAQ